ncbi:hypothetical protein [Legionella quinlivanii]|nr:hypothetical protein [Legionella quinlivanii]
MSIINKIAMGRIPKAYRSVMGYYPDLILYECNQNQFESKWQQLARADYIYTEGYKLRSAGRWRYYFESLKGWFGFTNHCDEHLVQLSLRKFAYYGYLKGYRTRETILKHPLPQRFQQLVNQNYSSEISAELQRNLLNYYRNQSSCFPQFGSGRGISPPSYYGSSFAALSLWDLIPCLDPQDSHLITQTRENLEPDLYQRYSFLNGSHYARAVANYYLAKAKEDKKSMFYGFSPINLFIENPQVKTQRNLGRALYYDSLIYLQDIEIYIDYFLEKKDVSSASNLILQLKDLTKACAYLIKHFNAAQHLGIVEKSSPLAIELTKHYLRDSKNIENIRMAMRLDPGLEKREPAMVFRVLVANEEFEEAYTLYQGTSEKRDFDKTCCSQASVYFHQESEKKLKIGRDFRGTADWEKAASHYSQALTASRQAYELSPCNDRNEHYSSSKRFYAQILIDADEAENTDISKCKIAHILYAIKLLKSCQPTDSIEKQYHQKALVKALMRKVDYFCELIRVPATYSANLDVRKEHLAEHTKNFKRILESLKEIVTLLEGAKEREQKLILGKAYFLLGDINYFFDLNENNLQYFRKAVDTVPLNPFYNLRYYERLVVKQETYRDRGIKKLKDLGFEVLDWLDWDKERWDQDFRISNIKQIHLLEDTAKPSGWFSSFSFG